MTSQQKHTFSGAESPAEARPTRIILALWSIHGGQVSPG